MRIAEMLHTNYSLTQEIAAEVRLGVIKALRRGEKVVTVVLPYRVTPRHTRMIGNVLGVDFKYVHDEKPTTTITIKLED
ncbi:hypothetical protein [Yersinia phage vB_YenM_P778]